MTETAATRAIDAAPAAGRRNALDIRGLNKTFPGQRVLRDVALAVACGEVHALVGQNGCGKSTLIKILAGYHEADPGGVVQQSGKPATGKGIAFMHQDLALIPTLNTVDNLALRSGYEMRTIVGIDWRAQVTVAERAVAALGGRFDVTVPVSGLKPGEQAVVAMARAVNPESSEPVDLLVLDEPTAYLARREVETLFSAVRRLVNLSYSRRS